MRMLKSMKKQDTLEFAGEALVIHQVYITKY